MNSPQRHQIQEKISQQLLSRLERQPWSGDFIDAVVLGVFFGCSSFKLFHILTSQFATTTVTFRIKSGCCYRFVLSLRWSTFCRFLESDLKSFKWRSSHVQHQIFSTCVPNFQDDVGNQTPRCLHKKMHL